jgi:hypothetical protein
MTTLVGAELKRPRASSGSTRTTAPSIVPLGRAAPWRSASPLSGSSREAASHFRILMHPNQDFRDLLFALNDAGADYLVVGAHALAAHGHVRATKELDI